MLNPMQYKIGMFVKMKTSDELLALNTDRILRFTQYDADIYACRLGLIINKSHDRYQLYFPDTDSTHAWSEADEFDSVSDLLSAYRDNKITKG